MQHEFVPVVVVMVRIVVVAAVVNCSRSESGGLAAAFRVAAAKSTICRLSIQTIKAQCQLQSHDRKFSIADAAADFRSCWYHSYRLLTSSLATVAAGMLDSARLRKCPC